MATQNLPEMTEIQKIQELLKEINKLPKLQRNHTYIGDVLEVYREPDITKVLEFFFDPKGEHGFGTLFLDTFLGMVEIKNKPSSSDLISIESETYVKPDDTRGYIDIVIEFSNIVIGIEHKIDADLYNDFKLYIDGLEQSHPKKEVFIIVFSKKKQETKEVIIYYDAFFKKIKESMGKYLNVPSRWLGVLQDFLAYVDNLIGEYNMTPEQKKRQELIWNVGRNNGLEKMKDIAKEYERNLNTYIPKVVKKLSDALGASYKVSQQNDVILIEFSLNGKKYTITSWRLENVVLNRKRNTDIIPDIIKEEIRTEITVSPVVDFEGFVKEFKDACMKIVKELEKAPNKP